MSVLINSRGTLSNNFAVGQNGMAVDGNGVVTPPDNEHLSVRSTLGFGLSINSGNTYGLLTTDTGWLKLQADVVDINGLQYPKVPGLPGQVLTSNGVGLVEWTTAGAGTVTSVAGEGSVNGITLTGTVTGTGQLTLGGQLSVYPSNFGIQTAGTVLSVPPGANDYPVFRVLEPTDIPVLNQDTTGEAATATRLSVARLINGVAFDGTSDITIPVGDGAVSSVSGKTGDVLLDKADVGLSNVDNTSDLDKPISIATQVELDSKAGLNDITAAISAHVMSGDPHVQYLLRSEAMALAPVQSVAGRTGDVVLGKADVGLENVDNTPDSTKHVASAERLAVSRKINGIPFDGTADIYITDSTKQDILVSGVSIKTLNGNNLLGSGNLVLGKADVGLSNVDNTSDIAKPVSNATQTALNGKANTIHTHSIATGSVSGFMSAEDKVKLDSIDPDAIGVDGASAYEIAVANGYVGTETQWLASLVGPPGSDADLTAHESAVNPHPQYLPRENGTAERLTLSGGYTETVFSVTGTTPVLSPTNASIQTWVLTGNSTPTSGTWSDGQSIVLMVTAGSNTITWTGVPVVWKTGGGMAPTLQPSDITPIMLVKIAGVIYGFRGGDA